MAGRKVLAGGNTIGWPWENYTVGPVAGGRSDAVVPVRFERASDVAHLAVVSTYCRWVDGKCCIVGRRALASHHSC